MVVEACGEGQFSACGRQEGEKGMGKQACDKNLPPLTNFLQLACKIVPPDQVQAVAAGTGVHIYNTKQRPASPFS